jgi:hypothetical protein
MPDINAMLNWHLSLIGRNGRQGSDRAAAHTSHPEILVQRTGLRRLHGFL